MQNFCKIGLNPEELELLEYALVISFFKENLQWGLSNLLFNFSCGSCKQYSLRSFIKGQTSGTSSDNKWYSEWQRMTSGTSNNEWYNEWQRVATSDHFG